MMLVDSHCHLDFPDFGEELDAVLDRARQAGVGRVLTICTHPDRLARSLGIAERYDDVFCAVGVHPHEAASAGDLTVERLVEMARHPRIVGIGETGLDYHYDHSPRDEQQASFRLHIRAARAAGLPVIVHTRSADDDTIRLLQEEGARDEGGPLKGVIHCFSSGRDLAEAAVALGLYISVSGILTFKPAEAIREAVRGVPNDRLLVETDAPYLAPVPLRGKRNEPAFVVHTAARLAELKSLSPAEMAAVTTANFFALFDKVPAPAAAA